MMIYGIIYKLTNNVNNKIYIGQTTQTIERRMAIHKNKAKEGNSYINKAIRKYGWEHFSWDVIYECTSKDELDQEEIKYIKTLGSHYTTGKGYNITKGGDYNPMQDRSVREKRNITLRETMKNFRGDNNIMKDPDVIAYHQKRISEVTKSDWWIASKALGDTKQYGEFIITDPQGISFTIKGLGKYCRENGLSQPKMSMVASGLRNHHKGYKCERVG